MPKRFISSIASHFKLDEAALNKEYLLNGLQTVHQSEEVLQIH